jgi:protein O-GlcNAc transferase
MNNGNDHGLSLPEALQQAIAAYRVGQWSKAQQLCRAILHRQGNHFEALTLLGSIAAQMGHAALAADLFHHAVAARPENAIAHVNYGNALQIIKRFEAALDSYERALKLKPDDFEAYVSRGNVQQKLKRFEAALDSYERALKLKPGDATVYMNRGVALNALKRFEGALDSYERALRLNPDYADAYVNRGNVQGKLKRFEAALDSYERAVKLKPDDAAAYMNRGLALNALKRFAAALHSYDCALKLRPDYADAYNSRGIALHDSKHLEAALDSYEHALKLKPDYADAYNNRGATLQELKRFDAALDSYERALKFDPDFAEAYLNRGNVLRELTLVEAALDSYEFALQLKPDYAEACSNRGELLTELKRFDAALDSYERALRANPDLDWLYGVSLHARMHLCAWQSVNSQLIELATKIEQARRATPPFHVLGLIDSLSVQRRAAETWVRELFPQCGHLPPIGKRGRRRRIRLGYYSSDFHEHATTHLMAELFERHDRDRFELVAFSFGRDAPDDVTKRISDAFDQFLDVRTNSDKEVAQISRELEIDIAVDLKGHTKGARTGIFAYRAAPVQVNYLGYPGTMGAPYIDYIIADPTLIPEESRHGYSEKICYLPNSYQVNESLRQTVGKGPTRKELGLSAADFVFCCFNNVYKITPSIFEVWTRILRRVEGSVLWLLGDSKTAIGNLRREAAASGLSAARLVFASRVPIQQHLARHCAADLFVDTSPCNAHTTASDALRTGLPVITCVGESFAARVGASLLTAIGLPELITPTPAQYEALAVELATSPTRLSEIRETLHRNRLTAPLFDTARFTKHLEDAYCEMYGRHQEGLSPEHIFVVQ